MFRIIIIFMSVSAFAYIFGFVKDQPTLEIPADATIPELAQQAAKFNPLDVSPAQLKALSEVPLRQSQGDIVKRSAQVKESWWNKMVSMTEGFDLGAISRALDNFPSTVSTMFGASALATDKFEGTEAVRDANGNIVIQKKR